MLFFRAVLCKGAKYPPVLPRPTLLILPFQLPLCEVASDRGALEVGFILSSFIQFVCKLIYIMYK